jgi:hypothetical protein
VGHSVAIHLGVGPICPAAQAAMFPFGFSFSSRCGMALRVGLLAKASSRSDCRKGCQRDYSPSNAAVLLRRDGQSAHVAAEFHETAQMIPLQLDGVHPVEVVSSEIFEVHAVTEHVVSDDKNAVGHGDPGPRRSAALADTSELRAQVTLAAAAGQGGVRERRMK